MKNSTKIMSTTEFEKIINKAKDEGYNSIGLYNWMEPFMCTNFYEYVAIVKKFGLSCSTSSNLSIDPTKFEIIEKTLMSNLDSLIISVSGFRQDTYAINHSNGNIFWVKENIEKTSKVIKYKNLNTNIRLRFIKFDYNTEDEILLEEYAKSLDINFESIPGVGDPRKPNSFNHEQIFIDRIINVNYKRIYELKGTVCPLIFEHIAIDSNSEVYLCCAFPYYNCLKIGKYLNLTKEDILLQRYNHTHCLSCNWPRKALSESNKNDITKALNDRFILQRSP